ncbi:hypothetical protein E3J84_03625 [Candidatus Aerophobetes bacterium]|uniref:Uncharacterized protein n=1 Tax=Aerophobetes bacterium TaxID=2030807 RepID=A0A523RYE6_UNCAE|nr:MAG: hypothetical protein E3J84_03625 [Candidatus Aerophobetes bacterium]
MRNEILYKTLKEYCKTALAFLETKVTEPKDLPTTITEKIELSDDGGFSSSYVTEILWNILVDRNERDLTQMKVYQTAVQALRGDAQIAKHLNNVVGTAEMRVKVDTDTCLRSLFVKFLQEQQGASFQGVIFDKVYEEFENYFYRDTVEYRFLSPLNSFQMEIERIQLSPRFYIIKIPKEEKEKMLSHSRRFGLFSKYQMMPFSEYAFELFVEVPKLIGEVPAVRKEESIPSQIAKKQFGEACSALRLFKNGAFSHAYIRVGTTSWELHGGTFTVDSIARQPSIGTLYRLSGGETSSTIRGKGT